MGTLHMVRRAMSSAASTSSRSSAALRVRPVVSNSCGSPRSTEQSDFFKEFVQVHQPPLESIDYFASIPWAKKILDMKTYDSVPFYSRYLDEHTGESRFFAETINTTTTVPHVLSFCRKGLQTPASMTEMPESAPCIDLAIFPDVVCLIHLGRDLEAHPGIVNGGFQGVIFDEVMYLLILLHQNNVAIPGPRAKHYTLSITTKFFSPVKASSDVLVRASLVHRVGRKWFARAEIVDNNGKLLTSGESWWLTARTPLS